MSCASRLAARLDGFGCRECFKFAPRLQPKLVPYRGTVLATRSKLHACEGVETFDTASLSG